MKQAVAWFAENRVAANLLMLIILAAGIFTISSVKKEIFPEMSMGMISIAVPYLGAAPEEVEEGVCVRIEETIQGLEGIKKITSTASEGMGSVIVEVLPSHDTRELLDDLKSRVDAIETFPDETERPVIREIIAKYQVINVAISGEADEVTLKRLGEQVRDEITALPSITNVKLATARPYEISIEVSEDTLRRHRLTLDEVARAVRHTSLDLPGSSIKTASGEILLRSKGQAYTGEEFERIVILSRPDGTRLTVGDVAVVVDGFAETDQRARFNGQPAVLVQVFQVGNQNAIKVADAVKQYVSQAQAHMPQGISLTVWLDYSSFLRSRTELLVRNGYTGLLLLFIVLALFLKLRLAIWVSVGIPISFLGAIAPMPSLDVSVNMLSLFAFILVLGIVVGRRHRSRGEHLHPSTGRGEPFSRIHTRDASVDGSCNLRRVDDVGGIFSSFIHAGIYGQILQGYSLNRHAGSSVFSSGISLHLAGSSVSHKSKGKRKGALGGEALVGPIPGVLFARAGNVRTEVLSKRATSGPSLALSDHRSRHYNFDNFPRSGWGWLDKACVLP